MTKTWSVHLPPFPGMQQIYPGKSIFHQQLMLRLLGPPRSSPLLPPVIISENDLSIFLHDRLSLVYICLLEQPEQTKGVPNDSLSRQEISSDFTL